jgi:hypothetical protein
VQQQIIITRIDLDTLDHLDSIKAQLRRTTGRTISRAEIIREILRGAVTPTRDLQCCGTAVDIGDLIKDRMAARKRR